MRKILFALFVAFGLFAPGAGAHAAPKSELWERWAVHDETSERVVDHSAWDAFLKKYVKTRAGHHNTVDYAGVTSADKMALDNYVKTLTALPVSTLNRRQQKAYWINLYNALTLGVVLDHYPVESIRDIDISPGLFSDGPWGRQLVEIEGEPVSLNDIEHRILRPVWKDPRVHYAVNCASVGCPNLVVEAFLGANTDALLDAGAIAYINSPRGVRVNGSEIIVSSIYDWFQEDFGGNEKAVIAHLIKYAKGSLKSVLEKTSEISGYDYDWSLNSQ